MQNFKQSKISNKAKLQQKEEGIMNQKQFLFEKNDCKVYKLTVLNHSYFIVEHAGKRYIRKSSAGVNGLMKSLAYKNH